MRIQDILRHEEPLKEPEQSEMISNITDAHASRIAVVSTKVNSSTVLIGNGEPQNLNVFLGENLIADFGDIEVINVGVNLQSGDHEWVVNVEVYGLVVVPLDCDDTVRSIEQLVTNTPVILDMTEGSLQSCMTIEADVTCRSIIISDFLDRTARSYFRPKPDCESADVL